MKKKIVAFVLAFGLCLGTVTAFALGSSLPETTAGDKPLEEGRPSRTVRAAGVATPTQIDTDSIPLGQANFVEAITSPGNDGATFILTEDIVLSDDDFEQGEPLFCNVTLPTTVLMGSFTLRLEEEDSNNMVSFSGPFHFIGEGRMFEVSPYCALRFEGVTLTVEGEEAVGLFAMPDRWGIATIDVSDCRLQVTGDNATGILVGDGGHITPNGLFLEVSGSEAVGIRYESDVLDISGGERGVSGAITGTEAVGIHLADGYTAVLYLDGLEIHSRSVGALVESGATLRPAGTLHVLEGGTGILVEETGELRWKESDAYPGWFHWEQDRLVVQVEDDGTGVGGLGSLQLFCSVFQLDGNATAVEAEGDVSLIAVTVEGGGSQSVRAGGSIQLDSSHLASPPPGASVTQRKAAPYLPLLPWQTYSLGDFSIGYGGYSLDWFGFFLRQDMELSKEDLPGHLGLVLHDPERPSAELLYLILDSGISWDISEIDNSAPGSHKLAYRLDLPDGVSTPSVNHQAIPFQIYSPDRPFLAYAQSVYGSYIYIHFYPQLQPEGSFELSVFLSDDQGESWRDITQDTYWNPEDEDDFFVLIPSLLELEEREYQIRIELSGSQADGTSNILSFHPSMLGKYRGTEGDRDGGDQGEGGELPGGEVDPDPNPDPKPGPEGERDDSSPSERQEDGAIFLLLEEEEMALPPPLEEIPEDAVAPKSIQQQASIQQTTAPALPLENQKGQTFTGVQLRHLAQANPRQITFLEDEIKLVIPTEALLALNLGDRERLTLLLEDYEDGFLVELFRNDEPLDSLSPYGFSLYLPRVLTENQMDWSCRRIDADSPIPALGYDGEYLVFELELLGLYALTEEEAQAEEAMTIPSTHLPQPDDTPTVDLPGAAAPQKHFFPAIPLTAACAVLAALAYFILKRKMVGK